MFYYDGKQWKKNKYKITYQSVVYEDNLDNFPGATSELFILTAEQQIRFNNAQYKDIPGTAFLNYVIGGVGALPDDRSPIDILLGLIPKTDITNTAIAVVPKWVPDFDYKMGTYLRWDDKLYTVAQPHLSQKEFPPGLTTGALYALVLTTIDGTPIQWVQPGSTNGYKVGDKVVYKGVIWTSKIAANVTIPDGDVPYNRYWTDK